MIAKRSRILLVDDDVHVRRALSRFLSEDFAVVEAGSAEQALETFERDSPFSMVVSDVRMPGADGISLLDGLVQREPGIPVLLMTAYADVALAVEAIKKGAVDFIVKPFDGHYLLEKMQRHLWPSPRGVRSREEFSHIIGESSAMQEMFAQACRFGPTNVTLLLEGASGTGKELMAKAIHYLSAHKGGPFVELDCACLPNDLVESEIFGYERGAFTGANVSKPGLIEMAHGGTLFLDEIGNLGLDVQAKLLRVLQERRLRRLGARKDTTIDLDIRVIAATNVKLEEAVETGAFRRDLYYRINAVTIELPPLSERKGDIELLASHFMGRFAKRFRRPVHGIDDDALECLNGHDWPGNVRELQNVMTVSVLNACGAVKRCDLPDYLRRGGGAGNGRHLTVELNYDLTTVDRLDLKAVVHEAAAQAEKAVLLCALHDKNINRLHMAEFLGIDPKTLRAKLKQHGIN